MLHSVRKALGVITAILVSAAGWCQTVQTFDIAFDVSRHGLAHTLIFKVEAMGGPRLDQVLAFGEFNPPEPDGLAHDGRRQARIVFNRPVKLRDIQRLRFSVRGDRPGQDVTTSFDFPSFDVINRTDSNAVVYSFRMPAGQVVTIDRDHPTWETPMWERTYDPAGTKQVLRSLKIKVNTGGDDLRHDSSCGALVVMQDGRTFRINFGRSTGLGSNSTAEFTIPVGSAAIDSVARIQVFKSIFYSFTRFEYRHLAPLQKFTNADDWDLAGFTLTGATSDGEVISKRIPELEGRYTEAMRSWSSGRRITPLPLPGRQSFFDARTVVELLLDDNTFEVANSADLPELNVSGYVIGQRTEFPLIRRVEASTPFFAAHPPAMWFGDTIYMHNNEYGGAHKNSAMRAEGRFWRILPHEPLQALKVNIAKPPQADGTFGGPYHGRRTVTVKAVYIGFYDGEPLTGDFWPWQGVKTLAVTVLDPPVTLSARRPEVLVDAIHNLPPNPGR